MSDTVHRATQTFYEIARQAEEAKQQDTWTAKNPTWSVHVQQHIVTHDTAMSQSVHSVLHTHGRLLCKAGPAPADHEPRSSIFVSTPDTAQLTVSLLLGSQASALEDTVNVSLLHLRSTDNNCV